MYADHQPYDPVKAHAYYERTKKLKGRAPAAPKASSAPRPPVANRNPAQSPLSRNPKVQAEQARIGRLRSKIKTLQGALSEAEAALSSKRQKARATAKKNSDGKSTAKEKQASQQYRDKHQAEIKAKRKKDPSSGGSSKSSSKSVSEMSVQELGARIIKIRSALRDARQQLSDANKQLGQLAHSAITSEPNVDEHFALFKSAERIPSK